MPIVTANHVRMREERPGPEPSENETHHRMKDKPTHVIPDDYTEFLYWLKEGTEEKWRESAKEREESHWTDGARWIGMTDEEIDSVEKKYDVRFVPEHRQFLKILHAVDRKEISEHEDDGIVNKSESPFYYNWHTDDKEVREMLDWPYREILRDVLAPKGVWPESWGEKPESAEEKIWIFDEWFRKTPKLLPLTSHRFLVSDETLVDRPVLSVWGADTIVYAWSLKHFLLNEFSGELGLMDYLDDDEGNIRTMEYGDELGELNEREYERSKNKEVPFYKELISYWT